METTTTHTGWTLLCGLCLVVGGILFGACGGGPPDAVPNQSASSGLRTNEPAVNCSTACEHWMRCGASAFGVYFPGYESVANATDLTSRQLKETYLGCVYDCDREATTSELACWLKTPCSGISESDIFDKPCPRSE